MSNLPQIDLNIAFSVTEDRLFVMTYFDGRDLHEYRFIDPIQMFLFVFSARLGCKNFQLPLFNSVRDFIYTELREYCDGFYTTTVTLGFGDRVMRLAKNNGHLSFSVC